MRQDSITLARRLLLREIAAADPATIRRKLDPEAPGDVETALITAALGMARSATPPRRSPVVRLKKLLAELTPVAKDELWRWVRSTANRHLTQVAESSSLDFVSSSALAQAVLDEFRDLEQVYREAPDLDDRLLQVVFASPQFPWRVVPKNEPLRCDSEYTLKVALLPFDDGSGPARLDVVIYTFPGQLISPAGDAVGVLIRDGRSYRVKRQPPASPQSTAGDALLFTIRTPAIPDTYHIRCSVFAGNVLLQSRVISVGVGVDSGTARAIDYCLTGSLPSEMLPPFPKLSLMLNSNGGDSHTLRYYSSGAPRLVGSATFDAGEVSDFINDARDAMSLAAVNNNVYRYGTPDLARLHTDLIRFARRGYRFYKEMTKKFGGVRRFRDLELALQTPGGIELAIREGARLLLPIAMIYDHPFDTNARTFRFCDVVDYAIREGRNLTEVDCFKHACCYLHENDVICPSGFWGFRHWIAVPISRSGAAARLPTIGEATHPDIVVGMSTDPGFSKRHLHLDALRKLAGRFRYAESRGDLLKAFQAISPHLVYLFCHAGIDVNVPWFKVGDVDDDAITGDQLLAYKVDWSRTRPLVFLNGCRTAAASPGIAMSLVSDFIEVAYASGVIGTEVAAYESLAIQFAESFLGNFFIGRTAAEAVRMARLELLRTCNPLGLMYVPFVSSFVSLKTGVAAA